MKFVFERRHLLIVCVFTIMVVMVNGQESMGKGHNEPLGNQGIELPALIEHEGFMEAPMFLKENVFTHTPVVFRKAIDHWPARKLWLNDSYLSERVGQLKFTVERAKKENRSLGGDRMTMDEFLKVYQQPNDTHYMVGFSLAKKLQGDFALPSAIHCEDSLDNYAKTNMWFSSGGTKSVVHTDSVENILCVVDGIKNLLLYSPYYSKELYSDDSKVPYTSPIDVDKVDLEKFPKIVNSRFHRVSLKAGDCLYIPHGHWHQVHSLNRNIGINFWWEQFEVDEEEEAESVSDALITRERAITEEGPKMIPSCKLQQIVEFPGVVAENATQFERDLRVLDVAEQYRKERGEPEPISQIGDTTTQTEDEDNSVTDDENDVSDAEQEQDSEGGSDDEEDEEEDGEQGEQDQDVEKMPSAETKEDDQEQEEDFPEVMEIDGRNFTRQELNDYKKFIQDNHNLIEVAQQLQDSDDEAMFRNAGMEAPEKPEPVTLNSNGQREHDNPRPNEPNYIQKVVKKMKTFIDRSGDEMDGEIEEAVIGNLIDKEFDKVFAAEFTGIREEEEGADAAKAQKELAAKIKEANSNKKEKEQ